MTRRNGTTGMLLHADPAFASGSSSFSSGLETLVADGWVATGEQLTALMVDTIRSRWNTFDRVFLVRAWATREVADLAGIDREVEVSLLGAAARLASRRAGMALLGTWERLGQREASAYRAQLGNGSPGGHLCVAQGLVYSANGLDLAEAESLASWAVLSAYASGAVRLGAIGHRAAQVALVQAQDLVTIVLETPVDPSATPMAWTPVSDIAVERHSLSDLRLFAS